MLGVLLGDTMATCATANELALLTKLSGICGVTGKS